MQWCVAVYQGLIYDYKTLACMYTVKFHQCNLYTHISFNKSLMVSAYNDFHLHPCPPGMQDCCSGVLYFWHRVKHHLHLKMVRQQLHRSIVSKQCHRAVVSEGFMCTRLSGNETKDVPACTLLSDRIVQSIWQITVT